VAVLSRGCGGGANRRRARRESAPARAARAAVADAEGRQRCVRYCPSPLYWWGMGLRRLDRHGARPTNEASPRLRRQSLRVPSRTAARLDQQVRPPPLPCLAPSRSPAHRSAVLPATHLLWRYRPGAAGPSGVRPKAAACTAGCAAARAARAVAADAVRGSAGGWVIFFIFFILPVQCLTPPVRAFCVSRDRGGGGGGSSGPSTVSTRALVAAGSAASCGGAGGGAPCALRLVLIPPGAPRGSQAPGAAWAGAGHAPRTLGGIGAC